MNPNQSPSSSPAEQAAAWLAAGCVFLDTETTGFRSIDQIVDIAIVDGAGNILLNTLVRPTIEIPAEAYAIHGINNADVASAPSFSALHPLIGNLLKGRRVVIYNREYDERLLLQSAAAWSRPPLTGHSSHCAMLLYAAFYGQRKRSGDFQWQKLANAVTQCGLQWPAAAHRALADAQMTRLLVQHMASKVPAPPVAPPAAPLPLF